MKPKIKQGATYTSKIEGSEENKFVPVNIRYHGNEAPQQRGDYWKPELIRELGSKPSVATNNQNY